MSACRGGERPGVRLPVDAAGLDGLPGPRAGRAADADGRCAVGYPDAGRSEMGASSRVEGLWQLWVTGGVMWSV